MQHIKEREAQIEKEFALADPTQANVKGKGLWCTHSSHSLADMLMDRENGEQLIDTIIPLVEQIAKGKGHPGVITRDLFVALVRSIR